MQSEINERASLANDLLQRPLRARLDDETIDHVLTNENIGVGYDDGDLTKIEPSRECGAVAAVTDEGILYSVGDPSDFDEDFVARVPYERIQSVEAHTETLTQSLVVETTDEQRWEFTARRASAVDEAVDILEERLAEQTLAIAEEHHSAAKATTNSAECAEELEAALEAFRDAAELLGDERGPVTDAERTAREDAEAVIANLISSHRNHGEKAREGAEWELAADNDESAYELFVEARDAYDRALELARAYPPGDPETIERERAQVVETLEPLQVEFAVAEATDD